MRAIRRKADGSESTGLRCSHGCVPAACVEGAAGADSGLAGPTPLVAGTEMPAGMAYFQAMVTQFASFRLTVDGLVRNRLSLSLSEMKAMPARI